MIPVEHLKNRMHLDKGAIIAGELTDNGFFTIQYESDKKYLLNVNNKMYKELDGIDKIVSKYCFFDEKELIFYGFKGSSLIKFTIEL